MIVLPDRQNREMVVTLPPCLPASPFICLPSWSAAALSPFICPPFMISILACCWVRQPPCLSSFVTLYSLSCVSQCWFLCPPPPASPFIAFHLVSSFFGDAIWGLCRCNFLVIFFGFIFDFWGFLILVILVMVKIKEIQIKKDENAACCGVVCCFFFPTVGAFTVPRNSHFFYVSMNIFCFLDDSHRQCSPSPCSRGGGGGGVGGVGQG